MMPGPGPGPGDNQVDDLTILPANPVVNVDGKSPFKLDVRVTKAGQDVTAQSTLTVDNDYFGSFQGATLHGNAGSLGKTKIRAQMGNDIGSTVLTVRLQAVVIGPGAPPDSPGKFGGGNDPMRAPGIAYPPPGALMPPNINALEFQWTPGTATLFELHFVGDLVDLTIYTPCKTVGNGCAFLPDEMTMKLLTTSALNGTVDFGMRGSDPNGGGVGTAPSQKLSFSDTDMKGGLYYWAASVGGIVRYDFGLRGQKAESYYDPLSAIAVCVGCHAMSRNGQRIAVGMNIPGPALMRTLDTATKTKLFEVGSVVLSGSNYQAFNPDGSFLVTT
jgi:TolB protein